MSSHHDLPQVGQIISLAIHGLGSSGEGVGYFNGYTVFVHGALPGETVQAQLVQCKKRCGWAQLISISTASTDRVEPACPLFGQCGGCQLMHLSYSKQLEMKRQRVVDAFQRIGKIENCEIAPCVASPSPLAYRNKIQLPVKQGQTGIALGLYARSSHDLIEVEKCYIHSELGEQIYRKARDTIKHSSIVPYDSATGTGELRHLLIKSAFSTQEVLVTLVTNQVASPILRQIAQKIMASDSSVKGVIHNIQHKQDNVILGDVYYTLAGSSYIQERLCGLTFKVSAASFFQVNPAQAENLYFKALEFAQLSGQETVLDAYCGVGTLSLIFAKYAKKIVGVECVPEAIKDAQANAQANSISNASFVCATSESFIRSQQLGCFDVILLNPPRKGCELSFLQGIKRLAPRKLVYISCDPATLARDLAYLGEFGYAIEAVQPFDMFPQTAHVECVVKLKLNI